MVTKGESDARVEAAAAQEKAKGSERVAGIYERFYEKGQMKAEAQVTALNADAAARVAALTADASAREAALNAAATERVAAANQAMALSREHELKLLREASQAFAPQSQGNAAATMQIQRPSSMAASASSKPISLNEAIAQSKKLTDEACELDLLAEAQPEGSAARTLLFESAKRMKMEAKDIVASSFF